MDQRAYEPTDALSYLTFALDAMRAMNEDGNDWRSRQLSIAITEAETALLWAKAAFHAKGANVQDW